VDHQAIATGPHVCHSKDKSQMFQAQNIKTIKRNSQKQIFPGRPDVMLKKTFKKKNACNSHHEA